MLGRPLAKEASMHCLMPSLPRASRLPDVAGADSEDFRSGTLRCTLLRLLLFSLTPYGQLV